MGSLQNTEVDLIVLVGEAANQFLRSRQVRREKNALKTGAAIPGYQTGLHLSDLAIVQGNPTAL